MLYKILHPYHYQLLHYYLSKDNKAVECQRGLPRIFVLMSADYGNIGDIAITIAQTDLLRRAFPTYEIVNLCASSTYQDLKSLVKSISKNDIITFVGGGNSGDLYYPYEIYRQLVVSLIKHNIIICFPQSVKFLNRHNANKARRVYKNKKNLIYLARDKESYNFITNIYKVRSEVLPDIVMTMNRFRDGNREGVLTCFRNDKESWLSDIDKEEVSIILKSHFEKIENIDTYIPNKTFNLPQTHEVFDNFIDKISGAQILVTDRLHGMILGYITGTSTIVFPNNNNKIKGCHEWIKDCRYIQYIENIQDLESAILKLTNIADRHSDFILTHDRILREYDKLNHLFNNETEHYNSGI